MARTMSLDIDDKTMDELDDPFYSPENMARLKESIEQLESGKGVIHEVEQA